MIVSLGEALACENKAPWKTQEKNCCMDPMKAPDTVDRFVNSHGGKVWAGSQKAKGATLYFTLPKGHLQSGRHPQDVLKVAFL